MGWFFALLTFAWFCVMICKSGGFMEGKNTQEKSYQVNLGQLCRKLNSMVGENCQGFVGFYPVVTPFWSFAKVLGNLDADTLMPDKSKEEAIRNFRLDFSLSIKGVHIASNAPIGSGSPIPEMYFDKLSVRLCDMLSDGSHVYDHVDGLSLEDDRCRQRFPQSGIEMLRKNQARWIALNKDLDPRAMTVTISQRDIDLQKSDKAKDALTVALESLDKEKSQGGGKE